MDDVALGRDVIAGSVLRAVFTEEFRILVVHTLLNPTGIDERLGSIVVQRGVQVDGDGLVLPCAAEVPFAITLSQVDNLTAVEDIAERSVRRRSHHRAATLTGILVARL